MNPVCDSFGRAAARYDAFAPVQTAMANWLAEWLPTDRQGAALEIGAGTGLFTLRTLPWSGAYVASDASAGMVALGRSKVPAVEWRELAAARVGQGDWAWIFSASMLQWAEDPVALLRAWRDALSPGGRVLAGFYVADTLPELRTLFSEGREPLAWRSVSHWRESSPPPASTFCATKRTNGYSRMPLPRLCCVLCTPRERPPVGSWSPASCSGGCARVGKLRSMPRGPSIGLRRNCQKVC